MKNYVAHKEMIYNIKFLVHKIGAMLSLSTLKK